MKSIKRLFLVFCAVSLIIGASGIAFAIQTNVQIDPTGTGAYSITHITSLDWESYGNLSIESGLVGSATTGETTVAAWLANSTVGSTATFNIHGQTALGAYQGFSLSDTSGQSLYHVGQHSGTYEITMALDGQETATIENGTNGPFLNFTSISGNFTYYLDNTSPDSNPGTGTGYNDGTPILSGDLLSVAGSFILGGTNAGGSNTITTSVTSYDTNFINADPSGPSTTLVGTQLATTVQYLTGLSGNTAGANLGGTPLLIAQSDAGQIGQTPYKIQTGDAVLGADGNTTQFSAVPEPATMALLGLGLLGLAFVSRKKIKV